MIAENDMFLTAAETMKILRLKKSTFYSYVAQRIIPSVKVGHFLRFRRTNIIRFRRTDIINFGKCKSRKNYPRGRIFVLIPPGGRRIEQVAGKLKKRSKCGNSYSVRVEVPPGPDGKRRQKTITAKSYKELERKQRELLSQVDLGQLPVAPAKMTLGEFLDYYLDIVRTKRAKTYEGYQTAFKAFRRTKIMQGKVLLSDVTTDLVQRAVNELSRELEKSSLSVYFTNLKTAFKYAAGHGVRYLPYNPCDGVIIAKPDEKEKQIWGDAQAQQFLLFCKTTTMRYAILFTLLLKTGARIGEILALRWSDVDLQAGTIHITRTITKGGYGPPKSKNSRRKVPIGQGTIKLLSKHRIWQNKEKLFFGEGYNPENLVICKSIGKRLPYQDAYQSFKAFCKYSGLPYITPHGLRHTCTTMLVAHGRPIKTIAELLGDDPVTIEKTSARNTPAMRAEMLEIIEQVYEEKL